MLVRYYDIINIRYILIFLTFFLFLASINLVWAEPQNPYSMEYSTVSNDEQIVTIPPGSPEHFVFIKKEIYPEKSYYIPSESLRIVTKIKFISYKNEKWDIKDLKVFEIVDENLKIDNNSVKCEIYNDPLTKANIKYSKNITNNSLYINIPNTIKHTQALVYEYNVTVEKNGVFTAKTIVTSGENVGFYTDTEKILKIHVSNFDYLDPYIETIKGIIWVLIILSGLFTAYRGLVEKPTKAYHLKDVFSNIIHEYKCLLESVPYKLTLFGFIILIFVKAYSYISIRNPQNYPPIGLIIANNWNAISEFGPFIIVSGFIIYMLSINKKFKRLIKGKYISLSNHIDNNLRELNYIIFNFHNIIWDRVCNMSYSWSKFIFMVVIPSSPLLLTFL